MLATLGYTSLDALVDATIPETIRFRRALALPPAESEFDAITRLKGIASKNQVNRSYLGQGYYGTIVPPVIQRTVLENPGWYTAYTPYQAEIAQGRLEALLNFQTMVTDLTGLPIANASAAGRGDVGGRGGGAVARGGERRAHALLRGGRLPSADDRGGADACRGAWVDGGDR